MSGSATPSPGPAAGRGPRVDVGVVTWNTAELTTRALRHLLDTDQGCDLRVLVHDNASTDPTREMLAAEVPEAEIEASPQNLGFARAVNRLFHRSDAPWFLALNSDAWPEPGAVATMVGAATSHPRAAAVAPLLLRPDGTIEHSTHPFPSLGLAALDAAGGRHWLPRSLLESRLLEGSWPHDRPRWVDWAVGAALLIRRKAMEAVGPFDERFFMYVEDLEWCQRAHRTGWEIYFDPAAVVRHIGGASGTRRWGDGRVGLEAAYLRTYLTETLGPGRAAAYRALSAVACGERAAVSRIRGRPDEEAHWRLRLKAHAGLVAAPVVDIDSTAAHGRTSGTESQVTGAGTTDLGVPGARHSGSGSAGQPGTGGSPLVAVCIPTHGRSYLLPRLLRALEAQTLPPHLFEVIVVDDGSTDATAGVLDRLARASTLRVTTITSPVRRGPAAARNLAWRASSAPSIAFTDDDCVPHPDWLRCGIAALHGQPRVVVGRTEPPEQQRHMATKPLSRVMEVQSIRFFETCNVFYRRCDLEAVGGFDERFRRPSGEDTHMALAVTERGVAPHFAAEAVVFHDVRPADLRASFCEALRWTDLPLMLKGRPYARSDLVHRWVFWKSTHPPAILAGAGLAFAPWRPWAAALVLPWIARRLDTFPKQSRPIERVAALPGALALDLCEVAVMVRGSLRHRTLLL